MAEYALKDVEKPIGKLGQVIPKNLQSTLPSVSDLEKGLNKIVYKQQELSTENVDKLDENGKDKKKLVGRIRGENKMLKN